MKIQELSLHAGILITNVDGAIEIEYNLDIDTVQSFHDTLNHDTQKHLDAYSYMLPTVIHRSAFKDAYTAGMISESEYFKVSESLIMVQVFE